MYCDGSELVHDDGWLLCQNSQPWTPLCPPPISSFNYMALGIPGNKIEFSSIADFHLELVMLIVK